MVEAGGRVREAHVRPARLAAKYAREAVSRPLMRGERVERLVVGQRQELGRGGCRRIARARDLRPPDLLRSRLDAAGEPLPRDRELLVRPGHVDRPRLDREPAVADHPGAHGEPATPLLRHLHAHRPLRPLRIGPEAFEHLTSLRDLHERPSRAVARAHDRAELGSGLDRRLLGKHHEGPRHAVAFCRGIDHLDELLGLHRRHIALRWDLEDGSIETRLQLRRRHDLSCLLVGRDFVGDHRLARSPGLRVGRVGLDGLRSWPRDRSAGLSPTHWPAAAPRHRDGACVKEVAAHHLGRLHESRHGERAGGPAGHAVERRRRDRKLHRRRFAAPGRLPGFCCQRRLDVGVAHAHAPCGGAGLAASVSDVGRHLEREHGERLFGHAAVGLRRERDRKLSVGVGLRHAPRDPLGLAAEGQPWKKPAAPARPPHLPLHPPLHRRVGDGEAGVGRGRAGEHDVAAERHRLLRCRKRDQELRSLVFLDADANAALDNAALVLAGIGKDRPLPRQRA